MTGDDEASADMVFSADTVDSIDPAASTSRDLASRLKLPAGPLPTALIAGAVLVLLVLGGVAAASRSGDDQPAVVATADPNAVAVPAVTATPPAVPVPGATPPPAAGATPTEPAGAPLDAVQGADVALPIGTCLTDVNRPEDVTSVTPIGCDEPHSGEVYVSLVLTQPADAAYPGTDELELSANTLCRGAAYSDYVGVSFAESGIFAYSLVPTAETWAAGDRQVSCYLAPLQIVTGSLRDSDGVIPE